MPAISITPGREYKEWLGAPRPFRRFVALLCIAGGRRTGWMFPGTRVSITQLVKASSALTFAMPKFVIERDVPGVGELTDAEIRDISMKSVAAIRSLGHDIQWLHSYVTGDKVYCVYLAADESVVREHAKRAGLPANRVSAVRRLLDATTAE
jgi:hypothetical protein